MEIHDIPGSVTPDFTGQPPDLSALSLAVFESSSDVIYAKDRAGRMLYANPAALALIGKPARQVVGRTDREFLEDAAAAELVMANDRRIMLSGVAEEVEETVPLPDGTVRIWASRKVPYRDSQGKVVGLLGISRDITARKQLEAELRASRDRLSEVLNSITDGLAVIDTDWRCTYLNAAGADLLGVAPDSLVGQVVWDLYPEAEALNFGPAYRRAMQTQQAEHFEAFYPAPLNKWLECHAYPSPNGVSVFFRDVTHRHRDQQALERSEERFRRMFARNRSGSSRAIRPVSCWTPTRPSSASLGAHRTSCRRAASAGTNSRRPSTCPRTPRRSKRSARKASHRCTRRSTITDCP